MHRAIRLTLAWLVLLGLGAKVSWGGVEPPANAARLSAGLTETVWFAVVAPDVAGDFAVGPDHKAKRALGAAWIGFAATVSPRPSLRVESSRRSEDFSGCEAPVPADRPIRGPPATRRAPV